MSEHRGLPPDDRHTRATECARLRAVTNSRDSWRSHVHRTYTAQRVQPFKPKGGNVSLSLGVPKGVFSFAKENTPFVSCSATGAAFPAPRKGESKGIPSSEREYPLCLVQRQQALPSPPLVRGNQKGIPSSEREYPLCPVQRQQALPSPF